MNDKKWMYNVPIDDLEYPLMPREPEPFDAAEPAKPIVTDSQLQLLRNLYAHSLPAFAEHYLYHAIYRDLHALIDAGLAYRHRDYFVISAAGIAAVDGA